MAIELTAHTEPGARLVAIADGLREQLAARAAEHDRDAGAQRHEHRERDAGEYTPSGSRHHVEQRSKKWDDRPS